jgi:predicted nuclease of predicted toxin-antitoxin system
VKLLLFDDVPDPVFQALIALKIQVVKFATLSPDENSDLKVVKVARDYDAIVLTMDRDFTNEPLFAAMTEYGSYVVRLRPPKVQPPKTPKDIKADLAMMILRDRYYWEELFSRGSGVISCDIRRSRIKLLKDFPWYKESINEA